MLNKNNKIQGIAFLRSVAMKTNDWVYYDIDQLGDYFQLLILYATYKMVNEYMFWFCLNL